ncbi:MAG TPA: DUF1294 domain-containing protein [Planctomycetota bacterium]
MGPGAVLAAYGALSLACLVLYGWDKRQARRNGRRVPERTLHGLALAGGFVGAWLGMRVFRHKTQKPGFALVVALALVLHAAGWAWWWLE